MTTTSRAPAHQRHKCHPCYGLVLVCLGLVTVAFSVYMLFALSQQGHRTELLIKQNKILQDEVDDEHKWQIQHHKMIRAWFKQRGGWTDADIDAVLKGESGYIPRDKPVPVNPDSMTESIPRRMPEP